VKLNDLRWAHEIFSLHLCAYGGAMPDEDFGYFRKKLALSKLCTIKHRDDTLFYLTCIRCCASLCSRLANSCLTCDGF
jgi:hypothetical protein